MLGLTVIVTLVLDANHIYSFRSFVLVFTAKITLTSLELLLLLLLLFYYYYYYYYY